MNRLKKNAPVVCIVIALIAALGFGVAYGAPGEPGPLGRCVGHLHPGLAPAATVLSMRPSE